MERLKAYCLIGLPYLLGCIGGYFIFAAFAPQADDVYSVLLALFTADVAATVVVWLFGVLFKNSSFYDPYWSLIPWLMVLMLMAYFQLWSGTNILFLIVLGIWSWRLTINWAYTCPDLKEQDWRYVMYKEQNKPVLWHIINFTSINMIPTCFVFLALIPGVFLVLANVAFAPLALIGAAVILFGTGLELFADIAMHKFRKSPDPSGVMNRGLWKYSRHPNYLGEISIWLGVYLMMIAVTTTGWFWFAGFFMILILFVFISIPMAEKRQLARRKEYKTYQKTTSMLLLLPPKKSAPGLSESEPELL